MHLLIAGIPASGKSTFCRWLEEKKRFLHVDVEEFGALEHHGLATAWEAMFGDDASVAPFLEALEKFKRPVAIDWGFPPECLDTVRKLHDGGVMLWWFAADWQLARGKFAQRGYLPIQDFDLQTKKIKAALPDIDALFRSHFVYALPSTGIYTPPDQIWKSMLDTVANSAKKA
jgi:hypothetical protein